MKKTSTEKIRDEEEIQWHGMMALVEGIILQVLDNISISGKWYPRDISMKRLIEKRRLLRNMLKWFRDDKWQIWLSLYCNHKGYSDTVIRRNFEKIRKKSVKYVNKRIKKKKEEIQNKDKNTGGEGRNSV